jgi:hypothetical protein
VLLHPSGTAPHEQPVDAVTLQALLELERLSCELCVLTPFVLLGSDSQVLDGNTGGALVELLDDSRNRRSLAQLLWQRDFVLPQPCANTRRRVSLRATE